MLRVEALGSRPPWPELIRGSGWLAGGAILCMVVFGACASDQDGAAARQSLERIGRTLSPAVEWVPTDGSENQTPVDTGPWTVEERLAHYRVSGVVLATARRGEFFGQAIWGGDIEPGLELAYDQKFALGEASPLVAALAALRLVEEGKWSLETDIRLLEGAPAVVARRNEPVFLRDLLRQSSGLRPEEPTGVRARSLAEEFHWQPNAVRNWSESGESDWALLQLLIEAATATPWEEAVRSLVLEPLALEGVSIGEGEDVVSLEDSSGRQRTLAYRPLAARGVNASAGDAVQLLLAFCGMGAPSDHASLDERGRRAVEFLSAGLRRALRRSGPGGWGPGLRLGENGALMSRSNETAILACHPESGDAIAVMTNGGRGRELAQELVLATAREFGWPEVLPERLQEVAYPAGAAQVVVGTYRFEDPAVEVELSWTPQRLLLSAPESSLFPGEGAVETALIRVRGGLRRVERPDVLALDYDAEGQWRLSVNGRIGTRLPAEDLSDPDPASEGIRARRLPAAGGPGEDQVYH